MKTLAVLFNDRAGRARAFSAEALREEIRAAADWAEITWIDVDDDVPAAAGQACRVGADALAIVGGDGTAATVLETARNSGCASTMVPLPMGTANLLPRRLYQNRSFTEILSDLPGYGTVRLPAGEVADRLFFVALMVGAPVRFGQAREALRPGGGGREFGEATRRIRQGISSLMGSRPRLSLEDGERKLPRSGSIICLPGGLESQRADFAQEPRDVLEYLLVKPGDPTDLALKTSAMLTGMPDPGPAAIISREPAQIAGPRSLHLMVDGEVFKARSPAPIRLIPNAGRFAVPKAD